MGHRERLSPRESRRAWLYAALIVLCMLLCVALAWFASTQAHRRAVYLPPANEELLTAAQGLDSISITADFDPESRLLTATQTMTLHNPAGQALDQVVLRSYSGAYLAQDTSPAASDELFSACYGASFSPGGLVLQSAQVNGSAVTPVWSSDRTVLTLPAAWPQEECITVSLAYQVIIPECGSRFGEKDGVIALGNVFPTLALWENGAFRTEAYASIGDPFLSACANWTVNLTLPREYTVASTAWAEPVLQGDRAVYALHAQAVRDFALVISDQFTSVSAMADEVLVTACARNRAAAQRMVKYARQAIACYEQHYGPYLYPTFTLAETVFPYGGMEYPRMVMISSEALAAQDDTLEVLVAHETAHQWWYAMVGSDSFSQAWQDESLCEYALMDYIGHVYGASARENAAFERIETAMRITIPRGVTPGSPITYFQDLTEYTQVVYRRGAALWMALENLLGKDALDAALKAYVTAYRFGFASRRDLTALLTQAAGQDVSPLMTDYLDTYITN